MLKPRKIIVFFIAVLSLCASIILAMGSTAPETETNTKKEIERSAKPARRPAAADFSLPEAMSGKAIRLSNYKGKVVLLDFWATWCGPCRMEIPEFLKLRKELGSENFEIIGVSLDRKGLKVVQPFIKQMEITYPIVIDKGDVAASYGGINAVPTAFIIDRQGRVIGRMVGYQPAEVFKKTLLKALAEKN